MGFENWSRWQWVLVGAIAGLALGFVWNSTEVRVSATVGPRDFQSMLLRKVDDDRFLLSNIRLTPGQDGAFYLQYDQLDGPNAYRPYGMVAVGPIDVYVSNGTSWQPSDRAPNLQAYLDGVASANPEFQYHYAWWRETRWTYATCVGGAVLLIGIIWPTVLGLMGRVGLAKQPAVRAKKEEAYDLERFGNYEEPAPTPAAVPQDESRLDELNEALEQSLQQSDPTEAASGEQIASTAAATDAPVRKLDSSPLRPTDPSADAPQSPKDYAGQFYPVARTGTPDKRNPPSGDDR